MLEIFKVTMKIMRLIYFTCEFCINSIFIQNWENPKKYSTVKHIF